MEKELIQTRLSELSTDLANASIVLREQIEQVKALKIKVHRMEGAQLVLKELVATIEQAEKTRVPDSV